MEIAARCSIRNMKKLLAELNAMPGPVWVFGAYGVFRMWSWLIGRVISGSLPATWLTASVELGVFLAALLPLLLFWLLLKRSPYAVQQVSLYVGLKAAAHFVALILPLFNDSWGHSDIVRLVLTNVVTCVLWFGALRYFERSEDIARLFPAEERRRSWWSVVPMVALILICGE